MRRLALALLLWPSIALAQFAPQQWSAPQDGSNFALFDLGSLQVNNFSGGGVQCVESDNAGNFFPVSCSLIGGVSSVIGTAGHVSVSPTTGAVVVDLIATSVIPGSYTYAAFTVDADGRLTAVSSGTAPITSVVGTSPISCSGSPTATCSITGGTNQVQVGTGTNIGGTNDFRFDDSIGVTFQSKSQNASTLNFISNSNAGSTAAACTQWSQSGTPNTAPYLQACLVGSGYTGAPPGSAFFTHADTGSAQDMTFLAFGTAGISFNTTTSNLTRLRIASAGDLDFTAMVVPSTPAAGVGAVYVDSTSKNLAVKNDAGTVNHGAQTVTCGAHQFETALADSGASTCTQPAFSDLSGAATCAQQPALTGDTHSSAGSCATVTDSITDGGGTSHHTFGSWAVGKVIQTDGVTNNVIAGNLNCANLPSFTGDITTSAGSCATTLATVATAGTYGSGVNVLRSVTINAKGLATAISTSNKTQSISLHWAMNQTGLSMGQDRSQLFFPGVAQAPLATLSAAAGTSVTTTMAAAWGSNNSPPTFPLRDGYQGIQADVDVPIVAASGTGSATLTFALYAVVTNPATAANYTLVCGPMSMSVAAGSQSSFQTLGCSATSLASSASLVLLAYRTDVNGAMTITNLMFEADAQAWATP